MLQSLFLAAGLALATGTSVADTEIYRCALADGTVAFQEVPCTEPDADAATPSDTPAAEERAPAEDDFFGFVNPYDEEQATAAPVEPDLPEPISQDRVECIETTRDSIDAIDATLAENAELAENSRAHLAELLELTRQLRACKEL